MGPSLGKPYALLRKLKHELRLSSLLKLADFDHEMFQIRAERRGKYRAADGSGYPEHIHCAAICELNAGPKITDEQGNIEAVREDVLGRLLLRKLDLQQVDLRFSLD